MFASSLISVIVGVSLLFLGISTLLMGIDMRHTTQFMYLLIILIGIIAILLGIMFIFYVDAVSFLVSIQFYLIGFMMIIFAVGGLISKNSGKSKLMSILILVLGIISIYLAVFAMTEPIYIAIIIGAVLIFEGILIILDDD